jgi:hypothetical protein
MLSLKKRKHRKKTRRKIKKGGKGIRVYYVPIKEQPGTTETKLLYPIIEEISLNKAYDKQKYVKDANGKDIIPFFKESLSLSDFVPILDNGEENDVLNIFSGKYDSTIKVKQSTIYVHSQRDLQMIELYKYIKTKYSSNNELKLKLVNLLETYTHTPTKLNIMVDAIKKYIAPAAAAPAAAAPAAAAPAAAAPAAAAPAAFKTQFELPNDIDLTKLSMYESKILDKLYKEINDDIVKDIMRIINDDRDAPVHKLIYSVNKDNTYNNIRYVILTLMLNTDILHDYAVAAAKLAAAAANPRAAAVQGNINNNQIPALIAAIAAANPRAGPGPAAGPPPGDPLQAHALIAAIVAALARP